MVMSMYQCNYADVRHPCVDIFTVRSDSSNRNLSLLCCWVLIVAELFHGKIRNLEEAPNPREHFIFQSIHGLCARKNSTVC